MTPNIILASSSIYRRDLLQKLRLPFSCLSPDIDESPYPNENAEALVKRLAQAKAHAVANKLSSSSPTIIIASDQIATFNNLIIGKPLSKENATQQLQLFSNQKVTFLTSLCVLNTQTQNLTIEISPFHVFFRTLSRREIERYIEIEQPFDCAGSFKSEGLGLCLFEKTQGDDANSLIGLPLIRLSAILRQEGINPIG